MARIAVCGFEIPSAGAEALQAGAQGAGDNGRCGGVAFTMDNIRVGSSRNYRVDFTTIGTIYVRFYIRYREYPVAGTGVPVSTTGTVIFVADGSIEGGAGEFYMTAEYGGALKCWSDGNAAAPTQMGGTTQAMALDKWYRVNLTLAWGNGSVNSGLATVTITDPDDLDHPTSTQHKNGANVNGINSNGLINGIYMGSQSSTLPVNGGKIDLDDLVVDNASAPGPGFITLCRAIGAGDYTGWGSPDYRGMRKFPIDVTTPYGCSTTAAGDRVSFQVESPDASLGVTGTINVLRVIAYGSISKSNWRLILKANGVTSESPLQAASPTSNWKSLATGQFQGGWWFDGPIAPGGTYQVGIDGGPSAVGNNSCQFFGLIVEHSSPDWTPPVATGDIQIKRGSFVGTGTNFIDVACGFATPARPTAIFARISNGDTGAFWCQANGRRGEYSTRFNDGNTFAGIAHVDTDVFTLAKLNGLNTLGATIYWLAISDPEKRMLESITRDSTGDDTDNDVVRLTQPDFVIEAIIATGQSDAVTTTFSHYKGLQHGYDLSSHLNQNLAPQADAIQRMDTGQFELGLLSGLGSFNVTRVPAMCFRAAGVFNDLTLCEIGSYVGDNTIGRVIPFAWNATALGMLLVVPSVVTTKRALRWGLAATNNEWNATGTFATGITAADHTGFTVSTVTNNFNASGVTYHYLAFADGVDAAPFVPFAPGGIWHEYLVAGHACKSIDSWYVGGVRQEVASAQGDPDLAAYFLIPGYSAWDVVFGSGSAARQVVRNGHAYTLIYVKESGVSPLDIEAIRGGDTPITVNVQGIETVGDSSGSVIQDSFDIYKHLMQNWIFGSYQTGAWLATPSFPDSDGLSMMFESSFDDAKAVAARRVVGGYLGAGGFGLDGNFVNIREAIRTLNLSCDVDAGLNRRCQFFVAMTDDAATALNYSQELVDANDVVRGSLDVLDDFSNHFNIIPFVYARDYVSGSNTPWRETDEVRSSESIATYEMSLVMTSQELAFVRDQTTALDIARRKLIRHKDPPRTARFRMHVGGNNVELGDVRLLTHYGGIGGTGWSQQPLRVQRHTVAPDNTVEFECLDLSRLFEAVFILGDELVLPSSWPAASVAQRLYGYLADEVTSEFSTGDPGKRVR